MSVYFMQMIVHNDKNGLFILNPRSVLLAYYCTEYVYTPVE